MESEKPLEYDRLDFFLDALKDTNDQNRADAADAIGLMADPRAVNDLIQALKHESVPENREKIVKALKIIKDPRALEPLIWTLMDKDWRVRREVAESLGRIGDSSAVEPLIVALRDKDERVREEVASILGRLKDERAVEPLVNALNDENGRVQQNATDALVLIGIPSIKPLIYSLKDKNEENRARATTALSKIGEPAIDLLIQSLLDKNHKVRAGAAEALGKIGDSRAEEPLIQALKYGSFKVRGSAAEALGMIKDERAVEPLALALRDKNKTVRFKAKEALVSIGKPSVESLIKVVRDEDEKNRANAADALGMIRDERAIESLTFALKDENISVRKKAKTALSHIIKQDAVISHEGPLLRQNESCLFYETGIKELMEEKIKDSTKKTKYSIIRTKDSTELISEKSASESPKQLARYAEVYCPSKARIHKKFGITVILSLNPPDPNAKPSIFKDESEELPEVDIVIFADGFDIEDDCNTKTVKVDRERDTKIGFFLTPNEIGKKLIAVDFRQHDIIISSISKRLLVTSSDSSSEDVRAPPPNSKEMSIITGDISLPRLADLELRILYDEDSHILSFYLRSNKEKIGEKNLGYHDAKFGEKKLFASNFDNYILILYKKLSIISRGQGSTDPKGTMVEIGNELWKELIPDELKREYWSFKDDITSLLIASDEPSIPWEIIKPYRDNEIHGFFCEQFELSRWVTGKVGWTHQLPEGIALPVEPNDNGSDVVKADEEMEFIKSLSNLHPGIKVISPINSCQEVKDFIRNKEFAIMHFICHGKFDNSLPNNSVIILSDGRLNASEIHGAAGEKRPLIFINACEVGNSGFSVTGIGGWARRLIEEVHVCAFIGAMWEVQSELSFKFSKYFYTNLLKDKQPIAKAFLNARRAIRDEAPSNSTWLAYVLYANPQAQI